MTNYNDAAYIGAALKAICEQSFPPKELIVIDDGSTDNSIDIIKPFLDQYPFVRLIRNEVNRGLNYSVNRAWRLTVGDYIYIASSNDLVLPRFFEESMNLFMQYPQAGLCCADTRIENFREGTVYDKRSNWLSSPGYLSPQALAEVTRTEGKNPHVWMNTVIIRRDLMLQEQLYVPELEWHSDWFLAQVILARHGCCYIPEPLAVFRWLGDSYWYRGINNKEQYRKVFTNLIKILIAPGQEDIAQSVIDGRSLRFVRFSTRTPINTLKALISVKERNNKAINLFWHLTFDYFNEMPAASLKACANLIKSTPAKMQQFFSIVQNLCDRSYAYLFYKYDQLRSLTRKN